MISDQELDIAHAYESCNHPEAGAILQFVGVVRNNTNSSKEVIGLFYEAHEALAIKKITEIVAEAKEKYNLVAAQCTHRVGKLNVGQKAIVVTTAGAHRGETYEANRYIVDRVKYEAPIWKQELFVDGTTEWGRNSGLKPDFVQE
jgi:molybdopterin synthase catalytic subunit